MKSAPSAPSLGRDELIFPISDIEARIEDIPGLDTLNFEEASKDRALLPLETIPKLMARDLMESRGLYPTGLRPAGHDMAARYTVSVGSYSSHGSESEHAPSESDEPHDTDAATSRQAPAERATTPQPNILGLFNQFHEPRATPKTEPQPITAPASQRRSEANGAAPYYLMYR